MNEIIVSCIVPIYKVPEHMLKRCLDSLVFQDKTYFEIILVDDGSPDKCGEICDNYSKKYDNIIVIHQTNKGLCGARNTGFAHAKGKYIMFVDGDDWIEKNSIDKLINSISTNDDIIIFGTIKEFKNSSKKYNFNNLFYNKKLFKDYECRTLQKKILDFDSQLGDSTAKLYNKLFLEKNNLLHSEVIKQGVEAIDFNIRVFAKAQQIRFVDEYLYHYTYNQNSITMNFNENSAIKELEGYRQILNFIMDNKDEELKELFYIRVMHNIISTGISGYFNPKYKVKYKFRKKGFNNYLNIDIIYDSLENVNNQKLNIKYSILIFIIKNKFFVVLYFLAIIRYIQKNI